MPKHDKLNTLIIFLIFALGFACYANTLNGPFLLDDYHNIFFNGYVKIHHLSPTTLVDAAFKSPIPTRPIANISFAINHLVHGTWLPGYHLVNIAIHCLAAATLYLFIKGTLTTPALRFIPRDRATWVAGLSALLWLVNPANTQSVSYIVQRMNSLAAMFFILSMLLYLRARTAEKHRPGYFAGCLLSGILAIGSKEIAITLPLLIFLYEWYFIQDLDRDWLKSKLPLLCVAAIIIGVVAWLYLGRDFSSILAGYQSRDFTVWQRLMTEARVICRYLSLIFFPYPGRLNLDHDYTLSTALLQPPATILSIIALAALFLAAIISAPRHRLVSFSILWFLLNLLIESSIIPLEIIFDHRAYLPIMLGWPALLVGAWHLTDRKIPPTLTLTAAIAILVIFSTWTFQRNKVWADEIAMNRDIVAKSPNKARAHCNLGRVLTYSSYANQEEGLRELKLALELDPTYGYTYLNLGGHYLQHYRYPEAISNLETVTRLMPGFNEVYFHLSMAYFESKRYQEAFNAAKIAITVPVYREGALSYLGLAASEIGDSETAIRSFSELSQDHPHNGRYRFNLGRALEKSGRKELAMQKYAEALEIASDTDKNLIQQVLNELRDLHH